jgi:hypothetical protein
MTVRHPLPDRAGVPVSPVAPAMPLARLLLLGACATVGPGLQAAGNGSVAGGLVRRLARRRWLRNSAKVSGERPLTTSGGAHSTTRCSTPDRRSATFESRCADRRDAHHGGARQAGDCRQHCSIRSSSSSRAKPAARWHRATRRGAGQHADELYNIGLRYRLGDRLLGQVPAQHRSGRCRLFRQYRAIRSSCRC